MDSQIWSCPTCTFGNHAQVMSCEMCDTPRPVGSGSAEVVDPGPSAVENTADDAKLSQDSGSKSLQQLMNFFMGSRKPHSNTSEETTAHIPAGYQRHSGALVKMVARECGHCNDFLLDGIGRLVRRKLNLGTMKPPADFLLKVDDAVLQAAIQEAKASMDIFRGIVEIAQAEEIAMRSKVCTSCQLDGHEVSLLRPTSCAHCMCRLCLRKLVLEALKEQETGSADAVVRCVCPSQGCGVEYPVPFIREVLSREEFDSYLNACMHSYVGSGSLVTCPSEECKVAMEVDISQAVDVPAVITEKDESGKLLSREAFVHFKTYRVRCRTCGTIFCSVCSAVPYHKGMTCDQSKEYASARHCRFCASLLKGPPVMARLPALRDACMEKECVERAAASCTTMLPCSHACGGVRDEQMHLPCLQPSCVSEHKQTKNQDADELCNICWVEGLGAAPALQLDCGHIFHRHCLLDKVEKAWPGQRITFGHLNCPLCKQPIMHKQLAKVLEPVLTLKADIEKRSLARLKIEHMEDDPKIKDAGSQFHNNPLGFAMASFAYYNCFKCKKAYFGGRRDCEQNAAAENRPAEEFVCYDCCDLSHMECKDKSHAEFHVWKCRFCCSQAVWFCWGTTHFCDYCHSNEPWARAKWPREKFKQCKGKEQCSLRVEHPPNGSEPECEFSLGCGACQNDARAKIDKEKRIEAGEEEAPAKNAGFFASLFS